MPSEIHYDADCRLCRHAVSFAGKHAKAGTFVFIPLPGSASGSGNPESPKSLVFINNNRSYTESDAVLQLAEKLNFPWNLLKIFRLVPSRWRNACYRFVARHRHLANRRTRKRGAS